MILDRLEVAAGELRKRTGWEMKPEGACKGDRCVPVPGSGDTVDVRALAERLGMALVHDERHALSALGPESGGRALASAQMPPLELPDREGRLFSLGSLRGTKVMLLAWASW